MTTGNASAEMTEMHYNEYVLEKLRVGLQTAVSKSALLVDPEVEWHEQAMTDQVIYQLRGFIWSQKIEEERIRVSYPRDWWQAFKERWFPEWLKDKYPVWYTEFVYDPMLIYPDLHKRIHIKNAPFYVRVSLEAEHEVYKR